MPEPTTPTDPQPTDAPQTPPAPNPPEPQQPTPGATPEPPKPEQPPKPTAPKPDRPDGVSTAEWDALGDPGKAAIVRERAAREAAEAKVREHERAKLNDLERAQAEAQEAKDAAAKATGEALRWRLAAKHGISDEDAEVFLTGSDETTLTAQAERVAALRAGQPAPRTPAPDPGQGPRPDGPKSEADQAYEAIYGAEPQPKA